MLETVKAWNIKVLKEWKAGYVTTSKGSTREKRRQAFFFQERVMQR